MLHKSYQSATATPGGAPLEKSFSFDGATSSLARPRTGTRGRQKGAAFTGRVNLETVRTVYRNTNVALAALADKIVGVLFAFWNTFLGIYIRFTLGFYILDFIDWGLYFLLLFIGVFSLLFIGFIFLLLFIGVLSLFIKVFEFYLCGVYIFLAFIY